MKQTFTTCVVLIWTFLHSHINAFHFRPFELFTLSFRIPPSLNHTKLLYPLIVRSQSHMEPHVFIPHTLTVILNLH